MTEIKQVVDVQLQDVGITDVQKLVSAIREANLGSVRTLAKTLVRIDIPGLCPVMEGLLDDNNPDLSLAAYDWFAKTSDQRASTILIGRLEDTNRSEGERWLAAEALGRRGDPATLASIRRVANALVMVTRNSRLLHDRLIAAHVSDAAARLLLRLAVAEAQLRGDELEAIPIVLALIDVNTGREAIVRVEAVNALASVVAVGMLDALRTALHDEDSEIVAGAIWALQLIGAREAVDMLVEIAKPERMELAEIALTAVVAVTGPGPGMDRSVFDLASGELHLWWQAKRADLQSRICYRCGKPISLVTFVELLRDPKQRAYAAKEFQCITGFDCGFDMDVPAEQQDSVVSMTEHWIATTGAGFKTGALYKYGRERDPSEAVRAGVFAAL